MKDAWKQVLSLVKKTGDRCIVLDERSEGAYVVMGLDSYEKLVSQESPVSNLTEAELLDKINRDIALWQSTQDIDSELQEDCLDGEVLSGDSSEDDRYYIEPVE